MKRLVLVLTFFQLGACGASATLVEREPAHGKIVLQGPYVPAMQRARELMLDQCNGRFRMREANDHVAFECIELGVVASADPAPNRD